MKKTITIRVRRIRSAAALAVALFPFAVFAQSSNCPTNCLGNPANVSDFQTFIANFLKAIVQISLPILTLFIVYSGFMFVTARGNQNKLSEAKMNFMYVIIGAILILGAWVLATLIASTANQVLGSS